MLGAYGVPRELHDSTLITLDKLDKIGIDGVVAELEQRGVDVEARERLRRFLVYTKAAAPAAGAQTSRTMLQRAQEHLDRDAIAAVSDNAARENLDRILELTEVTPAGPRMVWDPFLARGLSYYTGAIMEINVADLAGSLGGGGRYENLVGMFLGQNIPACGFSLGLERILVVMTERGMFPPTLATSPADVMVATFDASAAAEAMRVADVLRATGLRVFVYPDADKIGKQIKYADGRGIPFVALLGDDEIKDKKVTVKNLAAQTQQTYPVTEAAAKIQEALRERG
jgi:histidyl-tRNA synthetase